jgi:hypothetical protein
MIDLERLRELATVEDETPASASKPDVLDRCDLGAGHTVTTLRTEGIACYPVRRAPCEKCPWRLDRVGGFPQDSFRLSADTAYEGSERVFACHMAGEDKPQVCAGSFLSTGTRHNAALQRAAALGEIDPASVRSEVPLFESYRAMSIANGVDPNDLAIEPCR